MSANLTVHNEPELGGVTGDLRAPLVPVDADTLVYAGVCQRHGRDGQSPVEVDRPVTFGVQLTPRPSPNDIRCGSERRTMEGGVDRRADIVVFYLFLS